MEKIIISELRNKLSAFLRKVRAGESVLVVDRDQPVASLCRETGNVAIDERLVKLERDGLLRRGREKPPKNLLTSFGPKPRRSAVAALVEERHQGR